MLDEIINYVQSLQRQVEVRMISASDITVLGIRNLLNLGKISLLSQQFLSMKLSNVNPRLELDVDSFIPNSKEVIASRGCNG